MCASLNPSSSNHLWHFQVTRFFFPILWQLALMRTKFQRLPYFLRSLSITYLKVPAQWTTLSWQLQSIHSIIYKGGKWSYILKTKLEQYNTHHTFTKEMERYTSDKNSERPEFVSSGANLKVLFNCSFLFCVIYLKSNGYRNNHGVVLKHVTIWNIILNIFSNLNT